MRFIFFYLLLCTSLIFSQTGQVMHEIHFLPGEKNYDLYYSFRIPYNRLVFEKTTKGFSAEYEVMIELSDSGGAVIQRRIEDKIVSVSSFEETSGEDGYSEGLLYFNVPGIKIKLNAVFTDRKSEKEARLPERDILPAGAEGIPFMPPLIIYSDKVNCNDEMMFRLANFEGNIPFAEEPFNIILPVTDKSVPQIQVEVSRGDLSIGVVLLLKRLMGK